IRRLGAVEIAVVEQRVAEALAGHPAGRVVGPRPGRIDRCGVLEAGMRADQIAGGQLLRRGLERGRRVLRVCRARQRDREERCQRDLHLVIANESSGLPSAWNISTVSVVWLTVATPKLVVLRAISWKNGAGSSSS